MGLRLLPSALRFTAVSCMGTLTSLHHCAGLSAAAVRPPLPPFTEETARQKVQMAEDAWNSKDPERVALAYSEDSEWRNRSEFIKGREAIRDLLRRKWAAERGYVLRKYLWAHRDNRIAVAFEYEYHDASGQWYRAYGNENWEFDEAGLMRKRIASINEAPIAPHERRIAVGQEGAGDDAGGGHSGGAAAAASAAASAVPTNTWLAGQGVTGPTGEFPFGGGSKACY